jgi:tetratricopeptide (TPR) repeat protein
MARVQDSRATRRLTSREALGVIRRQLERLNPTHRLGAFDLHRLRRRLQIRTCAPGEVFLTASTPLDLLGVVIQGDLGVRSGPETGSRPVLALMPGDTFGSAVLTDSRLSGGTLQAITDCEIWILRHADLTSWAERDGARWLWRRVGLAVLLLVVGLAFLLFLNRAPTRAAIAVAPQSLGQWCSLQGHGSCAEQAWEVATTLAPGDAGSLLALGTLYAGQGKLEMAERILETASERASESPELSNNLGYVYATRGDHEQAAEAFRQALDLEPGAAAIEHNLGFSQLALGAHEQALAHYHSALALGEPQARTLTNVAVAYYELEHWGEAADAAREALRRDGDLATSRTVLGVASLQAGNAQQAVEHLRHAVRLDPNYGLAHYYLGLAYRTLDRPADSIAAFEHAWKLAEEGTLRNRASRHLRELYGIENRSEESSE